MTTEKIFENEQDFIEQYREACMTKYGSKFEECSSQEQFYVLAELIASKARAIQTSSHTKEEKKVYYFSLEFLLGPLLDNYLINFGIRDLVAKGVESMGANLEEICRQEVDPGLGNGGLGRLAACFLDSMAHEGIAGYGNGMRYRYGLFRQYIEGGRQVERTDNWLANGFPWETRKDGSSVLVRFGGQVVRHEENGHFWFTQEGGEIVRAVPYDVPIVGFGGKVVNKLRLWSAEPYTEDFDLDAFNAGDYARANKFRSDVEAISTILYPNDAGEHGRMLRLKQEYLFVSAGLQTILRTYEREFGQDWANLGKRVSIHTNDTHPAMCGPELMRILVDEKGVGFDEAYQICKETISFTNHTVMPEALEKWPINTFRNLLPRLYMFIDEIDRRYRDNLSTHLSPNDGNWTSVLEKTAILWDGQVRMANLSIIFSHSINGVSALHTQILKDTVFHEFYEMMPHRFNNKTNGVTHRRFLCEANPSYSKLITEAIGDGWLDDAMELEKLVPFEQDASFLEGMEVAKKADKERLAAYVKQTSGVVLDTNTVFDVQVKRFHAYKRQLLNVFKVLDIYNRLITDSSYNPRPTSFIFSGKAAQSYTFAKEVIRLINSVADVINNDERVNDKIKVAFVPNFAVSNAQLIYSAAEISEQISVAGAEASGTSNMKLMMNAAITLGTLDGANIEISELVGPENIKIFGLHADEVDALRASGRYYAWDMYNSDRDHLGRIVDMLTDGTLARLSGNFDSIHDYLMVDNDPDLVMRDFHSYVQAWSELTEFYGDRAAWNKSALHNTAKAGYFSSDRTIREYMADIWHI
ncbi:glycogen/starch/alpha-glucan phosphorylase [Thermophilibacter sp. ET337]|uniref:glycogen/starch/alpha-glucan phosphorylase n=1 Tax=Thermophilibacter sp. ET337 TaxID=2973084 RepID=UPI0021AC903C|nr:glycogen/starch/alpha-glucan phosphorylase [Thermophilibacter sp. ET337]MCR8908308.1 glycogen/starch/alpha-glucan phosphorylase [Thermophilibacter sp. ET337]